VSSLTKSGNQKVNLTGTLNVIGKWPANSHGRTLKVKHPISHRLIRLAQPNPRRPLSLFTQFPPLSQLNLYRRAILFNPQILFNRLAQLNLLTQANQCQLLKRNKYPSYSPNRNDRALNHRLEMNRISQQLQSQELKNPKTHQYKTPATQKTLLKGKRKND
jgi:hypothetical protein